MSKNNELVIIPVSLIRNSIAGLIDVCSKDSTRYAMMGVRIRVSGNTVNLCATDGTQASQINLSFENESKLELGEKILDPDLLKAIKAIKGNSSLVELHLSSHSAVIYEPCRRQEFTYIDAKYPGIDDVFKQNVRYINEKHVIGFNPELLLKAARSIQLANDSISRPKSAAIKMYIRIQNSLDKDGTPTYEILSKEPIVLESGSNRAIVMPMRL